MSSKQAGPSRRVTRAANKRATLGSNSDLETTEIPTAADSSSQDVQNLVTFAAVSPTAVSTAPAVLPAADSSDSDSDHFDAYIHPTAVRMSSATSAHATSVYANLSHPPILSEGELTPKALMTFEEDCNSYFLNAKGGVTHRFLSPHHHLSRFFSR